MSDFDHQLIELISTLTDEGQVLLIRDVVEDYGAELTERAVRDGFAVVADTPDDFYFQTLLPMDDTLHLLRDVSSSECVIGQAHSAIALEDEPNLVFRYAADDPEAIAEVRSRHGRE